MPPDHAVAVAVSELPSPVVLLRIAPIAAPSLAFEAPILRGWEWTYGCATELCHLGLPVPLAVFQPPDLLALDPAGLPTLVVLATPLPFEADLEDWCRFRPAATRWIVLDTPTVATAAGRAWVLTLQHGRGRRRSDTIVPHRGRTVAVHELGAVPPWAGDDGDAAPISAYFRLQHGPAIGRRVVEIGATGVRFEVPASWEVHRLSQGASKRRITCDAASATLVLGARSSPVSTAAERSAALVDHLACMWFTPLDAGRLDAPRDDLRAAKQGWRGGVLVDAIGPKLRTVEVRAWCWRVGPLEVDGTLLVEPDLLRPLGWMRAVWIPMASACWEAIAPTDSTVLLRLLGRLAARDLPALPTHLVATTHDLAIVHPGEPSPSFGLLLPRGLVAEPRPARETWADFRRETLTRYSDARRDIQITVTGTCVPFDVALVDWLAYAVECGGWNAEPPSRLHGPTERAAEGRTGVLRLVPKEQHTPGSDFWDVLHPDGSGGYSEWAIPAGAPPN